MKRRMIGVTEFKAKCLAILDEVGEGGGVITITKRGRPLATVGPARKPVWKSPEGSWAGKIEYDDARFPSERAKIWQSLREESGAED
jgi:prevent-host-death family protein